MSETEYTDCPLHGRRSLVRHEILVVDPPPGIPRTLPGLRCEGCLWGDPISETPSVRVELMPGAAARYADSKVRPGLYGRVVIS